MGDTQEELGGWFQALGETIPTLVPFHKKW